MFNITNICLLWSLIAATGRRIWFRRHFQTSLHRTLQKNPNPRNWFLNSFRKKKCYDSYFYQFSIDELRSARFDFFFYNIRGSKFSNETDAHLNAHAKTDLLERNPKLHAQSHRKKHSDTHENMDSRIKCASNTNSRMLHAHSHQHQYKGSRIWEATGDTSAHQAVLFLWKCECDVLVYAFVCVRYMFVATPK